MFTDTSRLLETTYLCKYWMKASLASRSIIIVIVLLLVHPHVSRAVVGKAGRTDGPNVLSITPLRRPHACQHLHPNIKDNLLTKPHNFLEHRQ